MAGTGDSRGRAVDRSTSLASRLAPVALVSEVRAVALHHAYPGLRDFGELAERVDPERILSNPFIGRCLGR